MLARIFTEDMKLDEMQKIVSRYFDGFTMIPTFGVWKGKRENTICIEIACEGKDQSKVEAICREIDLLNRQECCMVQYLETAVRFV